MPCIFQRNSSCAAFSLIEIIFTSSLLIFLMMVLLSVFPGSLIAVGHAEHRIEASHIAQSILEKRRVGAFSNIDAPLDKNEAVGSDGTVYSLTYSSQQINNTNPDVLRKISVTVSWTLKGRSYFVSQELYVCNIPK